MANIAATDITVTMTHQSIIGGSKKCNVVKLVFGDGALTYPAGGVPISKAALGCPNIIESLKVFDKGTSGYEWSFDKTNSKLVALQAPAQTHGHDFTIVKGAITGSTELGLSADATSATINNNTIAATRVLAKATGPVVSETLAAAVLGQPSAIAIAAQTLYVEVIGW